MKNINFPKVDFSSSIFKFAPGTPRRPLFKVNPQNKAEIPIKTRVIGVPKQLYIHESVSNNTPIPANAPP